MEATCSRETPRSSILMNRARGNSILLTQPEGTPSQSRVSFDARSLITERSSTSISKRYDIDGSEIGIGGYGKVFMAKDRMFKNRKVAIKRIFKLDEDKENTFKSEVQIMKDLDHPCICKIFETYNQERFMFFVIEYLEGGDLFEYLTETGPLKEPMVADICKQVAGALKYAHGHGVAHRDMKLENICFCDRTGTNNHVKVIDWGLGKYFGLSKMKSNVGTATYAAPEVLDPGKNDEEGYTCACDLWSLGVVAYSALCGRPPFWGTLKEQLKRMRREQYPLEEGVWETTSAEAKAFIRSLLKRNPKHRAPIDSVLAHPWLSHYKAQASPEVVAQVLSNLEQFSRAPDFFSLCVASVARQLDHGSLRGIREVFNFLDTNSDGVLDRGEVEQGFLHAFGEDVSLDDVEDIFSHLDLDDTDQITYTEFCAAGLGEMSYTEEHVLWAAFKTFDINDDSRITLEEMQQVLANADVKHVWSSQVCKKVASDVLNEYGSTDGHIHFEDWLHLMRECAGRQEASPLKYAKSVSSMSSPISARAGAQPLTPAATPNIQTLVVDAARCDRSIREAYRKSVGLTCCGTSLCELTCAVL